ncbi:MAG: OmpH family outer membrane protein [Bacteroidales bacterium]|jgi:outer membrane protein|nr:OmpH family outer membrane protein [Bacteroidales bacterium]MDD2204432.1 OmpH family outer membrane protein [Bacteroidales bacterium]MDD3151685.1 OmpH family outer membrane protein [Bacteroidales bacterium]MDD3913982.1 OmpH family outer membrane protein [Bacteroidales bacterium]MDD4633774.1 OmpH family outer membrane protein [Bacteroidales bacterium]
MENKKLKILSVISIVMSGCALVLWALYVTNCLNCNAKEEIVAPKFLTGQDSIRPLRVAYVNSDSLMLKYKLVEDIVDKITKRTKELDADYSRRQKQFESEASYFQSQVEAGSLSEESAQELYQKLMKKQEDLLALQDSYSKEISQLELEQNTALYTKVIDYLNLYNKDNVYFDYVLNLSVSNSTLLNVNDLYDISDIIINGLNAEYDKANKK